jgi:hypothetical protein
MIRSRTLPLKLICLVLLGLTTACRNRPPADPTSTPEPPAFLPMPEVTATANTPLPLAQRGQEATQSPRYMNLEMLWATDELVTVEQPAFYKGQLMGMNIDDVWLMAGGYEAEGRRRLLWLEPQEDIVAGNVGGQDWRDGLHQLTAIWPAMGLSVSKGEMTDLVLFEPGSESGSVVTIQGQLVRSGEDRPLPGELRCDTSQSDQWAIVDGATNQPLAPQADDSFQVMRHYLADDGSIVVEPGAVFGLDGAPVISCQLQPLPGGTYFAGWVARDEDGESALVSADFALGAFEPVETSQTFLDPDAGFQYQYPSDWSTMKADDQSRIASNPTGTIELTVTVRPDSLGVANDELKSQVLAAYGPVEVLYESEVPLAGAQASWTAYSYEASDGSHTGVLVSFVHNDRGYVVDVDGPAAEEEAILDVAGLVIDSWRFRANGADGTAGLWSLAHGNGLAVAIPAGFSQLADRAGWTTFRSITSGGVLAIRLVESSAGEPGNSLTDWLVGLHPGAAELAASDAYPYRLGRRAWMRLDFAYRSAGGAPIWGLLLTAEENGQPLLFWAEAPAIAYQALEEQVFLPAASSLQLAQ